MTLNTTTNVDGDVTRFVISPDSTRVAYIADQDTDQVFEAAGWDSTGGAEEATDAQQGANPERFEGAAGESSRTPER